MSSFLQEVAEDLVNRFGSEIKHSAIIFNNKRPATYLQKHLANCIQKPFLSPHFYTIQEFFAETTGFKIADFYLQFYTLFEIYNQLYKEEGLKPIKSSQFFPLAKIILSDFNQIDSDLVDADKLYRDLQDISTINKEFDYLSTEQYQFLAQFWTSYSEGKHKQQQENFIKMWRRMPKLYHRFNQALHETGYLTNGGAYKKIATSSLEELIKLQKFKDGKIIFIGFNALTNAEARVFKKLQDAGKALFYFDVNSYYYDNKLQEAGLFLRKNFNQFGLINEFKAKDNGFASTVEAANVYKVQGHAIQAKVLNNLLQPIYQKANLGTTAIVLADESLLLPTLQTIPESFENTSIDLNVTMGFSLSTSSIYGLVDLWVTTQLEAQQNERISFKNIEAFLTHPLTRVNKKNREKIQSALLKEQQKEVHFSRLTNQKGLFEVFFKKLNNPTEAIQQLLDILNFILNKLAAAKDLKRIDADLFVKTIQELNRLQDTLGRYIANEAFFFVFSLIQKALSSVSVPLSGDPLTGIQVMGLLESRNLNFDNIVFLGFNEGVVPKSTVGNSFIPDSLRRVYGLPVLENLDAISAYIIYRLIDRAKSVTFLYNSLTDEQNSGEPSRFLKQLDYESNLQIHYHEVSTTIFTQPVNEFRIHKTGNQLIKNTLDLYLTKKKNLSPSAITQYIANPVDFFFNYIAGIKEPNLIKEVVEPRDVGSILHKVMEYFYANQAGMEITSEWLAERQKQISSLTKQAFNAVLYKNPQRQEELKGMEQIILAIVEAYAKLIVGFDQNQAPFTIVSLEQYVTGTINFPLNGGEASITIGGIIDRVDVKDGITRIVDYKTGSDKLDFKDLENLFDTNSKHINKAFIQTLIYTYLYEQQKNITSVEPMLYIVKNINEGKVHFTNNRETITGNRLEAIKPAFLNLLKQKLTELFEAPTFEVSEIEDNYKYSIYKTIFGK